MLQVVVDGQVIPVTKRVVVQYANVLGPVSGKATDQLHHVFTPDGAIDQNVWSVNAPGVNNNARKSHRTTSQQTIATAANTAG